MILLSTNRPTQTVCYIFNDQSIYLKRFFCLDFQQNITSSFYLHTHKKKEKPALSLSCNLKEGNIIYIYRKIKYPIPNLLIIIFSTPKIYSWILSLFTNKIHYFYPINRINDDTMYIIYSDL